MGAYARWGGLAVGGVWLLGCVSVGTDDRFGSADEGGSGAGATEAASSVSATDPQDEVDDGTSDGSAESAADGDVIYDVGDGATAEGGVNGPGCQKADFLFIVDNSGSMQDEQNNLIASFPGFISTIQDTFDGQRLPRDGRRHRRVRRRDARRSLRASTASAPASPAPAMLRQHAVRPGPLRRRATASRATTIPGGGCLQLRRSARARSIASRRDAVPQREDGPRYMSDATPDVPSDRFSCVAEVGTFGRRQRGQPMAADDDALTGPARRRPRRVQRRTSCATMRSSWSRSSPTRRTSTNRPADPHQHGAKTLDRRPRTATRTRSWSSGCSGTPTSLGRSCNPLVNEDGAEPVAAPRATFVRAPSAITWIASRSVCAPDYTPFLRRPPFSPHRSDVRRVRPRGLRARAWRGRPVCGTIAA